MKDVQTCRGLDRDAVETDTDGLVSCALGNSGLGLAAVLGKLLGLWDAG